jgi:hypothetical protein
MAASDQTTPEAFAENFGDAIRIGFSWDRFFQERWLIRLVLNQAKVPGPVGDPRAFF